MMPEEPDSDASPTGPTHDVGLPAKAAGRVTGAGLVAAMQASPCRDIDLATDGRAMPVRDVVIPA